MTKLTFSRSLLFDLLMLLVGNVLYLVAMGIFGAPGKMPSVAGHPGYYISSALMGTVLGYGIVFALRWVARRVHRP